MLRCAEQRRGWMPATHPAADPGARLAALRQACTHERGAPPPHPAGIPSPPPAPPLRRQQEQGRGGGQHKGHSTAERSRQTGGHPHEQAWLRKQAQLCSKGCGPSQDSDRAAPLGTPRAPRTLVLHARAAPRVQRVAVHRLQHVLAVPRGAAALLSVHPARQGDRQAGSVAKQRRNGARQHCVARFAGHCRQGLPSHIWKKGPGRAQPPTQCQAGTSHPSRAAPAGASWWAGSRTRHRCQSTAPCGAAAAPAATW